MSAGCTNAHSTRARSPKRGRTHVSASSLCSSYDTRVSGPTGEPSFHVLAKKPPALPAHPRSTNKCTRAGGRARKGLVGSPLGRNIVQLSRGAALSIQGMTLYTWGITPSIRGATWSIRGAVLSI
eukprot:366354-Chlamydomonas_euryale.AAC.8